MQDLLHSFPGQEENEPVYVFSRSFPVAFLGTALVFVAIFAFSIFGQYLLVNNGFSQLSASSINNGILFLGAFQLLVLIVFLVAVLDFYFDIIIVTDRRVVDINQEQLFFRSVSELSLVNVEDVNSVIADFLPSLFNYGNVEIQTAGAKEKFLMDNIRFPREIAALTINLSEQAKEGVDQLKRVPETQVIGVIDNVPITSVDQLQKVGAMLPEDLRLVKRP